jgi:hypothetical protein
MATMLIGDAITDLLAGRLAALGIDPDGRLMTEGHRPALLIPGSFNPLHEAHKALARSAEKLAGSPAAFELSVTNVDKPPLPLEDIERRVQQFRWVAPVWLTRAATFVEKAAHFAGASFVVGADTAARLLDKRYHGHADAGVSAALRQIRAQDCRFLVACRADASQKVISAPHLAVPPEYRDMFVEIPEALFRMDLSSTSIRSSALDRQRDTPG